MRKLMVLPLAGLLALGVVGPVAAGPNVSNTSGKGETIYGDWSTAGGYGYFGPGWAELDSDLISEEPIAWNP